MTEVLGAIATCFSGLFFLVNAWQVKPFWQQGSVGEASAMPFLATMINAMLWLKYGLLKVDWPVATVNGMGLITSSMALIVYHRYAMDRGSFEQSLLQVLLGLTVLLLGHYWGFLSDSIIAMAAILSTLIMFITPLLSVINGGKHSFNLPMSIVTMCLCSLWAIYGWTRRDPVIMLPQLVGILVASLQLYLIYTYQPATVLPISTPSTLRKAKDSQEPL